jgi:hypothetical protein
VRCYEEHVGEHIGNVGNLLGTWKEHIGNQQKMEKKSFFPLPTPPPQREKRTKSKAPWVDAWAFPLAAWHFSSQKSLSPFSAWANTPLQRTPYPLNKEASGETCINHRPKENFAT